MMNPENESTSTRYVTFTYADPSGAVVVVRNVPATIDSVGGEEEVNYSIEVASKLQDLVEAALHEAPSDAIVALSFDDEPPKRDADYEFEFIGPEAVFTSASVQTWRLVFDKVYTSVKSAIRAATKNMTGRISPLLYPTVAFLRPASIAVGVRTHEQTKFLFDSVSDLEHASDIALNYLMDTARWLGGEAELPRDLAENQAVLEAMLRAVEDLSPSADPSITIVRFQRLGGHEISTDFSREKREKAKQQRIELRLKKSDSSRKIELIGTIDRLDLAKKVHLKEVRECEHWESDKLEGTFGGDLLPVLLENFGKEVRVVAIQELGLGGWSKRPEIIDVMRVSQRTPESGSMGDVQDLF